MKAGLTCEIATRTKIDAFYTNVVLPRNSSIVSITDRCIGYLRISRKLTYDWLGDKHYTTQDVRERMVGFGTSIEDKQVNTN
jgi:hypothetical protein